MIITGITTDKIRRKGANLRNQQMVTKIPKKRNRRM